MNVLSWNVNRLNDPLKIKEVSHFLKAQDIDVMGIMETRIKHTKVARVMKYFGAKWDWCSNYHYSSKGRLWVGRKKEKVMTKVEVVQEQLIHMSVSYGRDNEFVTITFIYGLHNVGDRKALWSAL